MTRVENGCVSCPSERGCTRASCPQARHVIRCCDRCGDPAEVLMEGKDYCMACAHHEMMIPMQCLSPSDLIEIINKEKLTMDAIEYITN